MFDTQRDTIMKFVLISIVIIIGIVTFGTWFPWYIMKINISYIIIAAIGILITIKLYK